MRPLACDDIHFSDHIIPNHSGPRIRPTNISASNPTNTNPFCCPLSVTLELWRKKKPPHLPLGMRAVSPTPLINHQRIRRKMSTSSINLRSSGTAFGRGRRRPQKSLRLRPLRKKKKNNMERKAKEEEGKRKQDREAAVKEAATKEDEEEIIF